LYTAPIRRLYITTENSSSSSEVQRSLADADGTQGGGGSGGGGVGVVGGVGGSAGLGRRTALTFVAGAPLPHVRCVAAGGFPPPSVSLFLDHADITDRFDVVRRSSLHGVHGLQVHITELASQFSSAYNAGCV